MSDTGYDRDLDEAMGQNLSVYEASCKHENITLDCVWTDEYRTLFECPECREDFDIDELIELGYRLEHSIQNSAK